MHGGDLSFLKTLVKSHIVTAFVAVVSHSPMAFVPQKEEMQALLAECLSDKYDATAKNHCVQMVHTLQFYNTLKDSNIKLAQYNKFLVDEFRNYAVVAALKTIEKEEMITTLRAENNQLLDQLQQAANIRQDNENLKRKLDSLIEEREGLVQELHVAKENETVRNKLLSFRLAMYLPATTPVYEQPYIPDELPGYVTALPEIDATKVSMKLMKERTNLKCYAISNSVRTAEQFFLQGLPTRHDLVTIGKLSLSTAFQKASSNKKAYSINFIEPDKNITPSQTDKIMDETVTQYIYQNLPKHMWPENALSALYFYLMPPPLIEGISTWQYSCTINSGGCTPMHVEYCLLPSTNVLISSEDNVPVYWILIDGRYAEQVYALLVPEEPPQDFHYDVTIQQLDTASIPYQVIQQLPFDLVTTKPGALHFVFTASKCTLAFSHNIMTECTGSFYQYVHTNYKRLQRLNISNTIPWLTPLCVAASDVIIEQQTKEALESILREPEVATRIQNVVALYQEWLTQSDRVTIRVEYPPQCSTNRCTSDIAVAMLRPNTWEAYCEICYNKKNTADKLMCKMVVVVPKQTMDYLIKFYKMYFFK